MAQSRTKPARRAGSGTRNSGSRKNSGSSRGTARNRSAARTRATSATKSTQRKNGSRPSQRRSTPSAKPQSTNGVLGAVGNNVGSAAEKVGETVGTAARKARTPALVGAAAAGIAGGVALGARSLARGKTRSPLVPHMGGTLKSVSKDVAQVGKDISKAGLRLGIGDVSVEVQRGKNGRKGGNDSPLEVLLHGLTARRSRR